HPLTPGANMPRQVGLKFTLVLVPLILVRQVLLIRFLVPLHFFLQLFMQPLDRCRRLGFAVPFRLCEKLGHEYIVLKNEFWEWPRLAGKLLWVFQRAVEDEPSDGVDINCRGFATE